MFKERKIIDEIDTYEGRLTRPQKKYLRGKVNAMVKFIDETRQIGEDLFEWYSPNNTEGQDIREMMELLGPARKWFNNVLKPENFYKNPGPLLPLRKKRQEENDIHGAVQLAHKWRHDQEERMKAKKTASINPYLICK